MDGRINGGMIVDRDPIRPSPLFDNFLPWIQMLNYKSRRLSGIHGIDL